MDQPSEANEIILFARNLGRQVEKHPQQWETTKEILNVKLVYFRTSEGKLLVVWGLDAKLSRAMAADVGAVVWVAQAQVMDDKSNWGNQQLITNHRDHYL